VAKRTDEEKLISSNPRQAVIFHPFTTRFSSPIQNIQIRSDNMMDTRRIDATSSVKNMSYNKSKSNASGTFSLELTSDRNWKHILRPGDWGVLYLSQFEIDTESTKGMLALVNIDRVSRQKFITNDGKKGFRYRVDGRDFGKIFEKKQNFIIIHIYPKRFNKTLYL